MFRIVNKRELNSMVTAQMAYPDAGKTHGDIGAKATETADGDKASVQFFLDLFPWRSQRAL